MSLILPRHEPKPWRGRGGSHSSCTWECGGLVLVVIAQEPHAGGPGTLPAVALGSPCLLPHLWLAGRSLTAVFYLPCSWSPRFLSAEVLLCG